MGGIAGGIVGGIVKGAALAIVAVGAVACGGGARPAGDAENRSADSAPVLEGLAAGDPAGAAGRALAGDSAGPAEEAADDSAPPGRTEVAAPLDSAVPLRTYGLLLVNPGEVEARVFASAGAGRVPLDTLPPGDSARVDVRVRATRLSLEAEDPGGGSLGRGELELREGSLHRWEVPGPTAGASEREATGPRPPPRLVPAREPDYARSISRAGRWADTRRGTSASYGNAITEGLDGA